jgi:hypothetical protein
MAARLAAIIHFHHSSRNGYIGISSLRLQMPKSPPDDLPTYRLLTGNDDATFCRRVSEALALGYQLYGSPAATFDGEHVVVAQAVLWPQSI